MKPEWKEYYIYLEKLRKSGKTNMFGATDYLVTKFKLDRNEAMKILQNWMKNYEEITEWLKQQVI